MKFHRMAVVLPLSAAIAWASFVAFSMLLPQHAWGNDQNSCSAIRNEQDRNICEHLGACAAITDPQQRDKCRAAEACAGFTDKALEECIAMFTSSGITPPRPEETGTVPPPAAVMGGGPPAGLSSSDLSQGRCITGYMQVEELCIHRNVVSIRGAAPQGGGRPPINIAGLTFPDAQIFCGGDQATGRIATYADYLKVFRTITDDQNFDPFGLWLGPTLIGDDQALIGNRSIIRDQDPNETNFEGIENKNDHRDFRCAYNLIPRSLVIP